jgi:hypothetical protein
LPPQSKYNSTVISSSRDESAKSLIDAFKFRVFPAVTMATEEFNPTMNLVCIPAFTKTGDVSW